MPISEPFKCRLKDLELKISISCKGFSNFSAHFVFAFLLCLKWSVLSSKQHLEMQDFGLMPSWNLPLLRQNTPACSVSSLCYNRGLQSWAGFLWQMCSRPWLHKNQRWSTWFAPCCYMRWPNPPGYICFKQKVHIKSTLLNPPHFHFHALWGTIKLRSHNTLCGSWNAKLKKRCVWKQKSSSVNANRRLSWGYNTARVLRYMECY